MDWEALDRARSAVTAAIFEASKARLRARVVAHREALNALEECALWISSHLHGLMPIPGNDGLSPAAAEDRAQATRLLGAWVNLTTIAMRRDLGLIRRRRYRTAKRLLVAALDEPDELTWGEAELSATLQRYWVNPNGNKLLQPRSVMAELQQDHSTLHEPPAAAVFWSQGGRHTVGVADDLTAQERLYALRWTLDVIRDGAVSVGWISHKNGQLWVLRDDDIPRQDAEDRRAGGREV